MVWTRKNENDANKEIKLGNGKVKNEQSSILFFSEYPKYTFDDIILPDKVKDSILDVVEYVHNSEKVFDDWGLKKVYKQSKRIGINFYGLPGTGKTMAAHAIAAYLGRKILVVSYADIESKFVGETPKNIRKAFETARETNSILFFDEADAILSKRVTNMSSAHDVSVNQTRSVMLMLMNDYQDYVIFATNFIENFDPAFMRRIATHIKFELPDLECRKKIWAHYILPSLPNNLDVNELATKYDNISGSDISTAVLKAAFKAARQTEPCVEMDMICSIIDDIIASKDANKGVVVERREVSDDYVKEQIKNAEKCED